MTKHVIGGKQQGEDGGAIIAYLIIAMVVMGTLAAISSYVVTNLQLAGYRQDMITAYQYAQGGAALACRDVETAFTNSGGFVNNLTGSPAYYVKNTARSTNVYTLYARTITSPFTNQNVNLEIWTSSADPARVTVRSSATVGKSTQTVQANLETVFNFGAAIVSTADGTTSTSVSKSNAQDGNACVSGDAKGPTFISGGILANGQANTNACTVTGGVSDNLLNTESRVPDYTDPGGAYQLFDFGRFTAAANVMGTHYTNLTHFITAAAPGTNLEGIIVVDIPTSDKGSLSPSTLPKGINVKGTLVFKFAAGWKSTDKIINTADMYINAANLTGLIANDPTTYTSGYPPTFTSTFKNPASVDISGFGYSNFSTNDDLPALMYNNAILDIHGGCNICGVVYSPCFMEIENKGSRQYFNGSLIGGGGIYVDGNSGAPSIIAYDAKALDLLATFADRGKSVKLVYQK
jgi:hypothetical protein